MSLTTIKVPVELRERISHYAKQRGVTGATLLVEALDELERKQRWESVRLAYAPLPEDDENWQEVRDRWLREHLGL